MTNSTATPELQVSQKKIGEPPKVYTATGAGDAPQDLYILGKVDEYMNTTYAQGIDNMRVTNWCDRLDQAHRFNFELVKTCRRVATSQGLKTYILRDA